MKKNSDNLYSLEKLRAMVNGDEDFVKEMITLFLLKAPDTIDLIVKNYDSKDLENLANHAHKLKSSIQIIGNEDIHNLVKDIESQALSGSNKQLGLSIERLKLQMTQLIEYLKKQI